MKSEILTLEEVADFLKTSVKTVRRLIGSGELPAFKVRGQLRVRKSDLEAYIDRQLERSGRP